MKKYYYINTAIVVLLAMSLISGIGHATFGGVLFALMLWVVPPLCLMMACWILYKHKRHGNYSLLFATIFTGASPWLALGLMLHRYWF